jgi:cell wall-associated NlpC family hydrolase
VITDPADSIFSAAHYLVASGALRGADGVVRALLAYNDLDWYVGDVLYYAQAYGGGTVWATTGYCGAEPGISSAAGAPLADPQVRRVLAWAMSKRGLPYVMGANGPDAYDCSSFTQAAYAQVGIKLPRTAQEQRDWLAGGRGQRIRQGEERPGDLIFTDSYLGPTRVGHVVIVLNPAAHSAIEAANSSVGIIVGRYSENRGAIFEVWRLSE